jgi:two-component system OmpR family sensor kinase
LSVVQTIAARLGARVTLGDAPLVPGETGLRVAVVFPAAITQHESKAESATID